MTLLLLLKKHVLTIAVIIVVVAITILVAWALNQIFKAESQYEVSINNSGQSVTVSSEDVAYQKLRSTKVMPALDSLSVPVNVINISGEVGAGAKVKFELEQNMISVSSLTTDTKRNEERTVIVFSSPQQEEAVKINKLFPGSLLSVRDSTKTDTEDIIIYAGRDILGE